MRIRLLPMKSSTISWEKLLLQWLLGSTVAVSMDSRMNYQAKAGIRRVMLDCKITTLEKDISKENHTTAVVAYWKTELDMVYSKGS